MVPLAQAEAPTDISGLIDPIRANAKIPGMAVVVLRGHEIAAQGASGVRQAGSSQGVTIEDHFHLGSDTKAMTATLIAILVEEGRLKWSTTIGKIFSGQVEKINPEWTEVTLDQLLTHRAGAPAELEAGGLGKQLWQRKGTPSQQRMELVRGVLARPPVAKAGTTCTYSNAGYALAGAMAEIVTGRPWEELMKEKIFEPLGITTAGFGAPGTPDALDQPVGHTPDGTPVPAGPNADNPPAIRPAGSINMSVPDWARFIALHLRGDPSNPHRETRILTPESFAHLHQPFQGPGEHYAAGWLVLQRGWAKGAAPSANGLALTHSGSNTMWFCVTWLAPERDFAVLIATNRGGPAAQKACDIVAGELIKKFNDTP